MRDPQAPESDLSESDAPSIEGDADSGADVDQRNHHALALRLLQDILELCRADVDIPADPVFVHDLGLGRRNALVDDFETLRQVASGEQDAFDEPFDARCGSRSCSADVSERRRRQRQRSWSRR